MSDPKTLPERLRDGSYDLDDLARDYSDIAAARLLMREAADRIDADAAIKAAATLHISVLEIALRNLMAELQQLSCGCTPRECLSGHRTDCRMPWVRDAEEKARALLTSTEPTP